MQFHMHELFSDFKALQGHTQIGKGTYFSYNLKNMEMQEISDFLVACVLSIILWYFSEL